MKDSQAITPALINDKIKWHYTEAKKLQDALDVIMSSFNEVVPKAIVEIVESANSVIKREYKKPSTLKRKSNPTTFKSVIVGILDKEQKPLTTNEALLFYSHITKKKIEKNSFSGQFSGLSSRDNALKKVTVIDNPIDKRFFYGLPEWFVGDELKPEYSEKIKAGKFQLLQNTA